MISTLGILTILVKILLTVTILGLIFGLTMYLREIFLNTMKNTQNNFDIESDLRVKDTKEENKEILELSKEEINSQDNSNNLKENIAVDVSRENINNESQQFENTKENLGEATFEEDKIETLELPIKEVRPKNGKNKGRNKGVKNL